MANEDLILLHAFSMGVFITFIYDIFRVLRRVFPHGAFLVSLEDICFWIYCAIKVFLLMHRESNGTLRWFAVLGALAGMALYWKLASPYFVKYVSMALRKVCRVLGWIWRGFSRPFCFLARKMRDRAARIAERCAVKRQKRRNLGKPGWKKKLTFFLRMVKMNL